MTDNGSPALSATNSFTVTVQEVNVAPSLPVIPAQAVQVQSLMTVTNTATNANIHSTISGYRLVNSPAGTSISANGIITWTPSQAQGPSTNTLTTVVTNSNPYDWINPHLTATNSFTVYVYTSGIPVIQSIVLTGGNMVMSWSAASGSTYRLQFTDGLENAQWRDVLPGVLATGPTATVTNAIGDSPRRFYRVLLVQ